METYLLSFFVILLNMEVVIVVPARNEGLVLKKSIPFLIEGIKKLDSKFSWHIIIVDNASEDDTSSIAKSLVADNIIVRSVGALGRGAVLRDTWLHTDADVYAYIDADLDIHPQALVRGIELVASGCDVVVGSKSHKDSNVERPWWRNFVSFALFLCIKLRYSLDVSDTQCGMKVLSRRSVIELLPLTEKDDWLFDLELLVLAKKDHKRIVEIPVEVKANRMGYRKSKVRVFATALKFFHFFIYGY